MNGKPSRPDDVPITPKMIEAGADALVLYQAEEGENLGHLRWVAEQVFNAMLKARPRAKSQA